MGSLGFRAAGYVVNGWVSGGKEDHVPDIFVMVTKPGVDLADARDWPPIGNKSLSGYEKKGCFIARAADFSKMKQPGTTLTQPGTAGGVAVADFDNDGRLDLFVTNADNEPFSTGTFCPRARTGSGLFCREPGLNRSAISAQVRLTEIRLAGGVTCRARPRFKGA